MIANTDVGSTQEPLQNSGSPTSPGALKAAEKITDWFIHGKLAEIEGLRSIVIELISDIIDRETGASDLIAALKLIARLSNLNAALKDTTTRDQNLQTIWVTADTAITKAEPPTQEKKGD